MELFLLGVGGAGNKAVIEAIENGVCANHNALLLNTTLSDIDEAYIDKAVKFGDSRGGCGKERSKAKNYVVEGLQDELKNLNIVAKETTDLVVIATSTEGGTGSGSSLILAKYINQVLGKPVQIFAFTGFEEDGRGLKNTIEFFQEVDEGISIQCISNSKFIGDTYNKLAAEKAANVDFVNRIKVLQGYDIVESSQNIDGTDLYKVSTQVGYTVCDKIELPKIKNVDQFNKVVKEALDNDQSLDTNKSVKRLAVFINAKEDTLNYVDYKWTKFKDKFGMPFEVYSHIQNDNGPEYISYIASGLDLPIDEVKSIYERYKENVEQVNKKKDTFADFASELKTHHSDEMFDLEHTETVSEKDFFKSLNTAPKKQANNNSNNFRPESIKINLNN